MRYVFLILLLVSGRAIAHEFTPTYPVLEPSYVSGVVKASMRLFNKRSEISYYEVEVFDSEWKNQKFAMLGSRIIPIAYLETKEFDVFFPEKNNVTYICTRSRLLTEGKTQTRLSSRICSKIK